MVLRPFQQLLGERLGSAAWGRQAAAAAALQLCREYCKQRFPSEVLSCITPISLRDGLLLIAVSHPAVGQRLVQQETELMAYLKERRQRVRQIRIVVRPVPTGTAGPY